MALGWLWWRAWAGLVAGDAAALCLAGVAQRNIHRRSAWQAWHLETFICYLRGRCGTWRHPTACHLRGRRALGDIHFGFASQAWHTRRCHTPSFCVAGVALGDIHLRFAWQVWHLVTSTCCLHGIARHHALSFAYNCVTHTTWHTPCLAQCMRLAFCVQTITFHFVTHNCFNFSILHHLLCLSFLPRPRYNLWCSLLDEVDLWGYPVLLLNFAVLGSGRGCNCGGLLRCGILLSIISDQVHGLHIALAVAFAKASQGQPR